MTEQNYGLIRHDVGRAALQSIPMPPVPDDYILVRTVAIALNPTDWTTLDAPGDNGTLVGCDYAGIVEKIGSKVRKAWKIGDRVAGFGHGGNDSNPQTGGFARYIIAKGDIQFRIPDGTSFEVAASIGVGVATVGLGLYKTLGFPFPSSPPAQDGRTILIYGGSTATGSIAIQLAKLSGLKVVTTCSPKNFDLVKQRGADLVFDYRVPDVGKQIRAATNNDLSLVFDTVNTPETAAICADAFGDKGGEFVDLLEISCPRSDVRSTFFLAYDISGEEYIFESKKFPADHAAYDFAREFHSLAEKLWAEGLLITHPLRIGSGGLNGALEGLQTMRDGRYSGEKLVYRVEETAWPN